MLCNNIIISKSQNCRGGVLIDNYKLSLYSLAEIVLLHHGLKDNLSNHGNMWTLAPNNSSMKKLWFL